MLNIFKATIKHVDKLVVTLNSGQWLENKKGTFFMPFWRGMH